MKLSSSEKRKLAQRIAVANDGHGQNGKQTKVLLFHQIKDTIVTLYSSNQIAYFRLNNTMQSGRPSSRNDTALSDQKSSLNRASGFEVEYPVVRSMSSPLRHEKSYIQQSSVIVKRCVRIIFLTLLSIVILFFLIILGNSRSPFSAVVIELIIVYLLSTLK